METGIRTGVFNMVNTYSQEHVMAMVDLWTPKSIRKTTCFLRITSAKPDSHILRPCN